MIRSQQRRSKKAQRSNWRAFSPKGHNSPNGNAAPRQNGKFGTAVQDLQPVLVAADLARNA